MELRDYLKTLWQRKWTLLLVWAVVIAGGTSASLTMTPVYTADTRLEVEAVTASGEASIIQSIFDQGRTMQTQVELIKSDAVLELAAKDLELPPEEDLEKQTDVELIPETRIIKISVDDPSPREAAARANAIAAAYIDLRRERALDQIVKSSTAITKRIERTQAQIAEKDRMLAGLEVTASEAQEERSKLKAEVSSLRAKLNSRGSSPNPANESLIKNIKRLDLQIADLDRQIADFETGGGSPKSEREVLVAQQKTLETQRDSLPDAEVLKTGGGTIIAPAEAPLSPSKPNIPMNIALAVVLGAILGIALAFLKDYFDDRIRTAVEIEERVGAPVVGHVPFVSDWSKSAEPYLVTVREPSTGAAEAYRTLRTNLKFLALDSAVNTLLVTSTVSSEGKTTTAANLAVAFAQGGSKTVLISADLRRPNLPSFFRLSDEAGLLQALDGSITIQQALQDPGINNLRVLSGGGVPPNPSEILASERFHDLLLHLQMASDMVIIDAPPVLGLAEASVLAPAVDGVLMVVNPRVATRRALAHAADQLNKAGGRVLGAVMNGVEASEGYGYYYQNYYAQYAKHPKHAMPKGEQSKGDQSRGEQSNSEQARTLTPKP